MNKRVAPSDGFNYSTAKMINRYLEGKTQILYPEGHDVFPKELIRGTQRPTSYP